MRPALLHVVLPVGISFYTFQALSYSIDVYRRTVKPTEDITAFFAFVAFFPQLVAGPIERASSLLPQFYVKRKFDRAKATDGMRQILWGLFKKMAVADNCALIVNDIFGNSGEYSGSTLLLGALFFTFQIYGDFSGYSDIATGTARLFGFNLMRNFSFPYFSRDIAEFWRRWHISLTTWFRDYVYIPLGGSRTSKGKVIRNTFVIFLLSGFWHGADWTFVCWGAYHAMLFLPLVIFGKNRKHTGVVAEGKFLPCIGDLFRMGTTFILVVFGWILFRAESVAHAWSYVSEIFSETLFAKPHWPASFMPYSGTLLKLIRLSPIFVLLLAEWLNRNRQHGMETDRIKSPFVRWSIYLAVVALVWALGGQQETFIYFQF